MKMDILPVPSVSGRIPVEEAIVRRRSVRRFSAKKLTYQQISQILWAAQGITETRSKSRSAPSAGAIHPLELYCVIPQGVFHYRPGTHSLGEVKSGDVRPSLAAASFGQDFLAQAPFIVVISTNYAKIIDHYGERGARYADMEAGHTAQNVLLESVALGLVSVPVGAFTARSVKELLGIPNKLEPTYLIPVGYSQQ